MMFESTRAIPKYERFVTIIMIGVFVYLNATNWCSAGWCYTYGWPFTFFEEGDSIVIINGEMPRSGFLLLPFLANASIAAVAILASTIVTRFVRLRRGPAV